MSFITKSKFTLLFVFIFFHIQVNTASANNFIIEPHTALEDARDFELPILTHIIKKRNWQDNIIPYDWNKFQVRDNFKA